MFKTILMLRRMRDMLEYHSFLNKVVKKATGIDRLPTEYLDHAIKGLATAYDLDIILKYDCEEKEG